MRQSGVQYMLGNLAVGSCNRGGSVDVGVGIGIGLTTCPVTVTVTVALRQRL